MEEQLEIAMGIKIQKNPAFVWNSRRGSKQGDRRDCFPNTTHIEIEAKYSSTCAKLDGQVTKTEKRKKNQLWKELLKVHSFITGNK